MKNIIKYFLPVLVIIFAVSLIFMGCDNSVQDPSDNSADKEVIQKVIDEDSLMSSFDSNFDESNINNTLAKEQGIIYPKNVVHLIKNRVNKLVDLNIVGDTIAYARVTTTYEGVLIISASYIESYKPDTLFKKPFTTTIVRNAVLEKVNSASSSKNNWKLVAVSLAEGGTENRVIDIKKLTVIAGSDTLEVENPLTTLIERNPDWLKDIPSISKDQSVKVLLEVYSTSSDTDYVSISFGANKYSSYKMKRVFELVSSEASGDGFNKVYSQTFIHRSLHGYFHAVINAFPKLVIWDDAAPVEYESWGLPYTVKK